MLNKCLLTVIMVSTVAFLHAQLTDVDAGSAIHENTMVPSYTVVVEPGPDWTRDAFSDYMKDVHDISLKGDGLFANKDVMFAEEVTIPSLSQSSLNFYARIVGEGSGTRIDVFAEQGGAFFSEDSPAHYTQLQSLLEGFLNARLLSYYQEKLEEQTKEQTKLMDEIQDLERDIAKNENDIAKMKREIVEKESENKQMVLEISQLQDDVSTRKAQLEEWQAKMRDVRKSLSDRH